MCYMCGIPFLEAIHLLILSPGFITRLENIDVIIYLLPL